MIRAELFKTENGSPCGFKVTNHGDPIVCAAVSALCINTVNSIEAHTCAAIDYDFDESGGYIECKLPAVISGGSEPEAVLLLKALALGLESVKEQYGKIKGGIEIIYKEVKIK